MKHKLTDFCFCFSLHQFIQSVVLFCCFSKQNGFPIILPISFIEPSSATSSKRLQQVRCLRLRGIHICYFPAEGPYGETLYRGFDKLPEAFKSRGKVFLSSSWPCTVNNKIFLFCFFFVLFNPIVLENSKNANKQAENVRAVIQAESVSSKGRDTGPLTNQPCFVKMLLHFLQY